MKAAYWFLVFWSLILFFLLIPACTDGDDSDGDDDQEPADDDDSLNDDELNDDAVDDDTLDDDTTDDDTPGGVAVCPIYGELLNNGELKIEILAGGMVSMSGTDIVIGNDGYIYITAILERTLCLYRASLEGAVIDAQALDRFADYPKVERDPAGYLHLVYVDTRNKAVKYATNESGSWQTTVIEAAGFPTSSLDWDLAVDAGGGVHLAYVGPAGAQVVYAVYAGGVLNEEIVATGSFHHAVSLALDGDGESHLAFLDRANDKLLYASKQNDEWQNIAVAENISAASLFDIVVDTADQASIAYTGDYGEVWLARKTGDTFANEIVHQYYADQVDFNSLSIAEDTHDFLHLTYYAEIYGHDDDSAMESDASGVDRNLESSGLYYATNQAGSGFSIYLVGEGILTYQTAMAVDSGEQAFIAFLSYGYPYENSTLQIVVGQLDNWSFNLIEGNHNASMYPHIALDSADRVYVYNGGELLNKTDEGWQRELVDLEYPLDGTSYDAFVLDDNDNPHVVRSHKDTLDYATHLEDGWHYDSMSKTATYVSLGVDAQGLVYIAAQSVDPSEPYENHRLELITGSLGDWSSEILDDQGSIERKPSMAVEQSGVVHIASFIECLDHMSFSCLNYSSNEGGSWSSEIVDDQVYDVGLGLAVDAQGTPHFSYMGSENLIYAKKISSDWQYVTVDTSNLYFIMIALALAGDGSVHLAYQDYGTGTLIYTAQTGETWTHAEIEEGSNCDLEIDGSGMAHLAYACGTAICYATFPQGYTGK